MVFLFLGIWEFFATNMCPFYTVKCFSSSLILPLRYNQLFIEMFFNKATLRKYSHLLVECQDSTKFLAIRRNCNGVATKLKDVECWTMQIFAPVFLHLALTQHRVHQLHTKIVQILCDVLDVLPYTAQKMKFSIKNLFRKCDQDPIFWRNP